MQTNPREWLRPELVRPWTEFLLVAALLLVVPIRSSTLGALHGSSANFIELILNDSHMLWSLAWESTVLALFFFYLHWRGWKPADFKIGIGWSTTAQGVLLLFAAWGAAIVTLLVLVTLAFQVQTAHSTFFSFIMSITPKFGRGPMHLTWTIMFVAMVVNAFLEELVFMGYIFNQLAARCGVAIALPATIFLRMACHTYQDPMHLGAIGALFTVYAVWYCFGRRLWPLILAHILLDTFSGTVAPMIRHLTQHGPALVSGG